MAQCEEYTPSVATPSRTPQPRYKGKKKRSQPRAQIYFARKIVLKHFSRLFPDAKNDEDVIDLFKKYRVYVCDVEFRKDYDLSTESDTALCAFVYTRTTRGQILRDNIWKLNNAEGWPARVLSNYRRDFAGKKASNGLHITSFDLFKDTQKKMEALFGKFTKGKKDGRKVSVILNIDRFGDPFALVFFKKEHLGPHGNARREEKRWLHKSLLQKEAYCKKVTSETRADACTSHAQKFAMKMQFESEFQWKTHGRAACLSSCIIEYELGWACLCCMEKCFKKCVLEIKTAHVKVVSD